MRILFSITMATLLLLCGSACDRAQDQSRTAPVEESQKKVEKTISKKPAMIEAAGSEEATLKTVLLQGNTLGIELTNSIPIRGVQFTLEGARMNEMRTTSRSQNLLADFNRESGKVVILSTSGDAIPPGSGLVAELVCDTIDSARLSEIKMVK